YLEVRPLPVIRGHPDWYWRVLHRAEQERGLDDEEDLFTPGVVEVPLSQDAQISVVTGTEPVPPGWEAAASFEAAVERQSLSEDPATDNPLACQLALAAEQFRVARRTPTESPPSPQRTVIAGYPCFNDWARDAMNSLPGLAMSTGM